VSRREELRQFKVPGLAQALCVTEHGRTAPPTHVLIRGNSGVPGDLVEPGFPEVLDPRPPQIADPAPEQQSTNRRRTLAHWIASPDNPLAARVMANRLWQHHFGRGLVRSPNDFGFHGQRPTHPELLDWLAAELIASDWQLKPLHRLIMMSGAYRMSSQANDEALSKDAMNDLFWRFDMRRLSAEEIRDSILAVNGTLNRGTMYGPSIFSSIPDEVLAGQSRPGAGWGTSPPADRSRRSVYIHLKRSLVTPILASFDAADTDASCPVRFATTQPTQALGMLNSEFILRQADLFAKQLVREAGGDVRDQVEFALRRTVQRSPAAEEIDRGVAFVERLRRDRGLAAHDALSRFCLVTLNLNEFVYLE
jgi:hypothetical protein